MFDKLNSLNLSLQGPTENFISSTSKLKSFDDKLTLWTSKISKSIFDCFPSVNKSDLKKRIAVDIVSTLKGLQTSFHHYFPSQSVKEFGWVINPFVMHETINFTTAEEEEIIELRNTFGRTLAFATAVISVDHFESS